MLVRTEPACRWDVLLGGANDYHRGGVRRIVVGFVTDTGDDLKTTKLLMNRKFYRFAYTNPPGEGRPRLHQLRDGAAFSELAVSLCHLGYDYGTVIHNYRNHRQPADQFRFLRQGDVIVMTTRPPLSDFLGDPEKKNEDKDKRYVSRSHDHLENALFKDLERFFSHVSRYSVLLAEETKKLLPPDWQAMATLNFHTKGKATIRSMEVFAGGRNRTVKAPKEFNAVGCFVNLKQISGYPCGAIVSFSMGGYENLLWNRIVRLRFGEWLKKPVFAFVGLSLPEEPPQPLTPEIADNAHARVLIERWLENGE